MLITFFIGSAIGLVLGILGIVRLESQAKKQREDGTPLGKGP